jgi:dolichyl-diphosphooligosaccharide---protein glycosyltransferase
MVQSVAEHAPATWSNYWQDGNCLLFFFPLGFYYTLVHKVTHGKLFIGMYGVFIIYFSSCMIRLMILMTPCMCLMTAISISNIFRRGTKGIRHSLIGTTTSNHHP